MSTVGLLPGEEQVTLLTFELLVLPRLLSDLQSEEADLEVVGGVAVFLVSVSRDPLLAVLVLIASNQGLPD